MSSSIMPPQKLVLSETGKQTVVNHVAACEHSVALARLNLDAAEKRLAHAYQIRDCNHVLESLGGIQASETVCTKCGFSWYD